jgi:1-pyrroline-5-carboxylate dehydrogenase
MKGRTDFQLTYATMYNPPEELHTRYETAVMKTRSNLGREYGMLIGGSEIKTPSKYDDYSPIDKSMLLARFQNGGEKEAFTATEAARQAFPKWGNTNWEERVSLVRKTAEIINNRIYELASVISLEVGKSRMEALADAAESADLLLYVCDQMEANNGYTMLMNRDPLDGYTVTNTSILRPYGVWVVISPFNFPAALTAGPVGAALTAGNTVVMKPATDTPWTVRLLADCFMEAGFPDGVVNFVTGPGSTLGNALVTSPEVDGITFTGSYDVGMQIYRSLSLRTYPRPIILEMGGKNPVIVSRNGDLDRAARGIVRSAFGLQGQKCSAASRILVEEPVYPLLIQKLVNLTQALKVGDPTKRDVVIGPVINQSAYEDFKSYSAELSQSGDILIGGDVLDDGELSKGYFCQPTIADNVPLDHPLWKHEMFLPITMIHKVPNLEVAIQIANDIDYGLTAGFYGNSEEARWFFENIEAGVNYVNRPHGATTGAWPGYQPFGGWKGSGSSGKNAGGPYYLQLYMREQVRTLVE